VRLLKGTAADEASGGITMKCARHRGDGIGHNLLRRADALAKALDIKLEIETA